MSVFRRKNTKRGSWVVSFSYRGSRYWKTVPHVSKSIAKEIEAKWKQEVSSETHLGPRRRAVPRFRDFVSRYLTYSQTHKRPRSHERDILSTKHLLGVFAERRLSQITSADVEDYKSRRMEEGGGTGINRELACLRHLYTMAVKWEVVKENPVSGVRLLPEPKFNPWIASPEEEASLYREAARQKYPPELTPLILVALHTGLRRGELLSLTWDRVDLRQGELRVEGKTGERAVPLGKAAIRAFRSIPRSRIKVFPRGIYKRWLKCAARCGLKGLRFHDLRHTFATRLLERGVDVRTVAELLGHKSLEMTMRYQHPSRRHLHHAVRLLDVAAELLPDDRETGTNEVIESREPEGSEVPQAQVIPLHRKSLPND